MERPVDEAKTSCFDNAVVVPSSTGEKTIHLFGYLSGNLIELCHHLIATGRPLVDIGLGHPFPDIVICVENRQHCTVVRGMLTIKYDEIINQFPKLFGIILRSVKPSSSPSRPRVALMSVSHCCT